MAEVIESESSRKVSKPDQILTKRLSTSVVFDRLK